MIIALPDILKLQSKHVTQPHLCYLNYAVSQPLPLTSPLPSQRPPQFPEHVTSSRAVTVPLIWLSRLDRPLRPPGPLASKSPHYVTERWLMFLSKGFCTVMVLIKYARCSFTLCIWNKSSHPAYTFFFFLKTAFSEIVWAGRRKRHRARWRYFFTVTFTLDKRWSVSWELQWKAARCSLTNVKRETGCVRLCMCIRPQCLFVWLCAYVHTHACICTRHKQTSICASNTAGLWWHVPVQPPLPGEVSVSHSHTVIHPCAHMPSI